MESETSETVPLEPQQTQRCIEKEVEKRALQEWMDTTFNNGIQRAARLHPFKSLYEYEIPSVFNDNVPWAKDPAILPPEMELKVLSIIMSVHLGRKLNLEKITKSLKNISYAYNPNAFVQLKIYLKKPRSTALLFRSGSMVVTGMKTEEDGRIATRRFARLIQKAGYEVRIAGMRIVNITSKVDFGFRIRMNDLVKCPTFKKLGVFNPEVFSGYSITVGPCANAKVIIFQTGQALISGVTEVKEAQAAMKFLYPFMRLCAV